VKTRVDIVTKVGRFISVPRGLDGRCTPLFPLLQADGGRFSGGGAAMRLRR